jgi:hypothetical protein
VITEDPKYSPAQLRDMARRALRARDAGDQRWTELIVRLWFATELHPDHIARHIEALAILPETEPA